MRESKAELRQVHTNFARFLRAIIVVFIASLFYASSSCSIIAPKPNELRFVSTIAGFDGKIGEPFGVATSDGKNYISDGQNGRIITLDIDGKQVVEIGGLNTPSGIAATIDGKVVVADSGRNAIYQIGDRPTLIAGTEDKRGFADGNATTALFNGPIGIAIAKDGKIFVADTYNDRIRVIENGLVSTLAGSEMGFADGIGNQAKFNTPCGIAIWNDKLLVADTGNNRIRVVEPDGSVWTLAGNGTSDLVNGSLLSAAFVGPTAVAVNAEGTIFVTDGNAIRKIGGALPIVTTLNIAERGIRDGNVAIAEFNRPSGLAFAADGSLLIADSENRLVRRISDDTSAKQISPQEIAALRDKPEEFRVAQPARWPYDPPTAKRDIAGTLGEVRGLVTNENDQIWFHNGLDIAGNYGETARFIRSEKVLKPVAAENFGTLRELIRLPTLGYIHIRLGRDSSGNSFGDPRFLFTKDVQGKAVNVRIPRGVSFEAGERIGTLNSMNHVHLVAGRAGSEMNALDALTLPGIADSRPPTIEKVTLFDQAWNEIETIGTNSRIKLRDPIRLVVKAYDQVDGNSERRRLGVYSVSYQIFRGDAPIKTEPAAEIKFDRMPTNRAVKFVYATGSHSGATGETIFNYIATNSVSGDRFREGFLDPRQLETGEYKVIVTVADFFGNRATRQFTLEVIR